jgi:hypothetical protein
VAPGKAGASAAGAANAENPAVAASAVIAALAPIARAAQSQPLILLCCLEMFADCRSLGAAAWQALLAKGSVGMRIGVTSFLLKGFGGKALQKFYEGMLVSPYECFDM